MKAGFLRFAFLALVLHLSFSEEPAAPQRRIAFTRDSSVWIANLDGTKMRKLVAGSDPCFRRTVAKLPSRSRLRTEKKSSV